MIFREHAAIMENKKYLRYLRICIIMIYAIQFICKI